MMRRLIAAAVRPLAALLHASGLMRREIIVKVDGGVCSQMHFYLVGQRLHRNSGDDVSYDLIWYDEDGMDGDNRFARNFDILKLCPTLPFNINRNRLKLSLYRLLYKHISRYEAGASGWQTLSAPVYLDGYYADDAELYAPMREVFRMNPADIDETTRDVMRRIAAEPDATGMHVRRGDLAVYVAAYGMPASEDYFIAAVRELRVRHGEEFTVFIFSDEPQWVTDNLMPRLPEGKYEIVAHNGSDRGYLDLLMLSGCRHFITSKGSFGKFAAMLSPRLGDVAVCNDPETRHWIGQFTKNRTKTAVCNFDAGILLE